MRTISRKEIADIHVNTEQLVICGAGYVAQALIRLGMGLGFFMTVIDDRPVFANQARALLNESQGKVLCAPFEQALSELADTEQTYFVIATRGHRYDLTCLRSILKKDCAYIGMMGSRGRAQNVRKILREEGFMENAVKNLHSPIGLAIGAKTPEEIAVSIMAELIQTRSSSAEKAETQKIELTAEMKTSLLKQTNRQGLLAVIVDRKGSAPRTVGTTMVIYEGGETEGTIGGGCMEAEVIREARQCMHTAMEGNAPAVIEVRMLPEEAETEGMVCGGIIQVELFQITDN